MKINIGVIGVGTVGVGFLDILDEQKKFFQQQLGLNIQVMGIAARSTASLDAHPSIPIRTTDPLELCTHPEISVILELAGGYDLPKEWVLSALQNKKHVVTANKALLAKYGPELFTVASQNQCMLLFEAAIGGAIPVVKTLQDSLMGNDILGLACIINGTCNYIMTEMSEKGLPFTDILKTAQEKGYAEADPTFDIEGIDSAHKVALLSSLCYGKYLDFEKMYVEGITSISKLDVEMAKELGFTIKLLGVIAPDLGTSTSLDSKNAFSMVFPALVSQDHLLASVNDVLNAVFIKTSAAGPLLLTGAGAGKRPTASSVMGDFITICKHIQSKGTTISSMDYFKQDNPLPLNSIETWETEYYLRFTVKDEAGGLSQITGLLANHNISIDRVVQKHSDNEQAVPIIITTHRVQEKEILEALKEIDALEVVVEKSQLLRFYS
jgi:homoserine dehydrogenase